MAFSYTINEPITRGLNCQIITGTYTNNGGSTGGDINLPVCEIIYMSLQPKGTSISANQPVINKTLPSPTQIVSIITSANETGYFMAICK